MKLLMRVWDYFEHVSHYLILLQPDEVTTKRKETPTIKKINKNEQKENTQM